MFFTPYPVTDFGIISDMLNEIEALGTKVCVSSNESIMFAENKYELINYWIKTGYLFQSFTILKIWKNLNSYAKALGVQKNKFVLNHISVKEVEDLE